jgi:hypothetical protein
MLWQIEAPFWRWAIVSLLLGLGFTLLGAVEAWLVTRSPDRYRQAETASDAARCHRRWDASGSVAGGFIAEQTSLRCLRAPRVILIVMFVVAFRLMHDVGFSLTGAGRCRNAKDRLLDDYGWRVPAIMADGRGSVHRSVGIYAFYASSPIARALATRPRTRSRSRAMSRRSDPRQGGGARIRALYRRTTS